MAHYFYVLVKKRKVNAYADGECVTIKIGDTTSEDPELRRRIYSINSTSRSLYEDFPWEPRATRDGWVLQIRVPTKTRETSVALALGVQAKAAASGNLYFIKQANSTGKRCTDYVVRVNKSKIESWIRSAIRRLSALDDGLVFET